jgi:hypothetical protein
MSYIYPRDIGYPCTEVGMKGMSKAEKAEHEKQMKKYRADADLDTLIRAEEIRKDPERLKEVKKLKAELSESLARIEGGK